MSTTTTPHTQTAYKDTPIGKIPADWEVKRLGEIIKGKGEYGINAPAVPYDKNLPKYIRITDIDDEGNFSTEKITSVICETASDYSLKEGDILFVRTGATTGKAYLYKKDDGELVFAGFLIRFKIDDKIADKYFVWSYTKTTKYENWVRKVSQRSGQPGLNSNEYSSLLLPLPPLSEQKRIAEVLSTWDKAIQLTEQLIRQKEQRKKWLMQQLLTGMKRLKGFSGEWKECKLGSLGDTYTGLTGKSKEDFGKGKPYIPYLNVFNNSRIDIKNLDYVKITEDDKQNKVKYGDIFFTVSSETPNEVGMASVILDEVDELYLNSFCFGFRLFDFNTLIPEFSSYLLRADTFRAKIYKLSQGATRFNLSKNNLMKLSIILPSKEEQTAIAEVLQAADKEIELLKAKAEKLKEQKKGLMQQLLTGKKRLNLNLQD